MKFAVKMKLAICAAFFVGGAVGGGSNRKCGANFEMEVAIMLDANMTETQFNQQKIFAKNVINWLPGVGDEVRVTLVPYVWELNKPTNLLSEGITRSRARQLAK